MKNNILKTALIVMISFCYLALCYLFYIKKDSFGFPTSWEYQFNFLLALSSIITLLIVLFKFRGLPLSLLLTLQIIIKYLITKPFSLNIWFEFFFIAMLLLEAVMLLTVNEIYFITVILLVNSFFTSHNDTYWGVEVSSRTWDLKIVLLMLIILISGFCVALKYGYGLLKRHRRIMQDQNNIIKKLSNANSGFQQYANLAEEKSIISERMRLTREIHDTVGYTMTNLLMMLEASTDLVGIDSVKLEKLLNKALIIIKDGHSDMRSSLRVLRNTKIKNSNSIQYISNLVEVFKSSTGVDVKVQFGNLPWDLNQKIDNIIYRFLQEGMTNSLTHGDAKKIDIHFWVSGDIIFINMIDDGNGCTDIKQGIGLQGMEERISEISGKIRYYNLRNGFSVKLEIPWENNG